jgi:hypothetical protein
MVVSGLVTMLLLPALSATFRRVLLPEPAKADKKAASDAAGKAA